MAAPTPQAGWYPDPQGSQGLRYWDGGQWTDYIAEPRQTPKREKLTKKQRRNLIWVVIGLLVLLGIVGILTRPDARIAECIKRGHSESICTALINLGDEPQ